MSKEKETLNENTITLDFNVKEILKKHYPIILLIIFMFIAFNLRAYHIDYPPIGYHNMKENQYLPYTYAMVNPDDPPLDYFRTRTFWAGSNEEGYFTQYEFPFLSWVILVPWKLLKVGVTSARFIIILFSLGCIPLLYKLTKMLTRRMYSSQMQEFTALTTCLLFTIMPLAVFFGRNIQPETPGLFMILLYTYFFLIWKEKYLDGKKHTQYFTFFSIAALVAILLKVPYGIGLVPLLFFVPYITLFKDKKTFFKLCAIFIICILAFPMWASWSKTIMPGAQNVGTASLGDSLSEVKYNINHVLTGKFFSESKEMIKAFLKDNFTPWFTTLTVLGVLLSVVTLIFAKKKSNEQVAWYIVGSAVAVIVYIMMFASKVRGHSYYQVPFLFLVCLSSTYVLSTIGNYLSKIKLNIQNKTFKIKYVEIILLVIIIFFAYPTMQKHTNQQFDVLFMGEDIAGDYINTHSQPDERVFMSGVGSQIVGTLWSAKRYGSHEFGDTVQRVQELENNLNFRWFFLYRDGLAKVQQNQELWNYVSQNYQLRQIGGTGDPSNFQVMYLLLEKGGTYNIEEFQQQPLVKAKTYEFTGREIDFYTITK